MARDEDSPKLSTTWIIDSGTSRHNDLRRITFHEQKRYRNFDHDYQWGKLHARRIGSVEFDLDDQTILMREVLHVPDLNANLLSIAALNRNGLNVLFRTDGVEIRRGNTLVARGVLKGKMYLLHASQTGLLGTDVKVKKSNEIEHAIDAIPENDIRLALYQLWHARMGHVNPNRLRSLSHHIAGLSQVNLLFLNVFTAPHAIFPT